MVKKVTAPPVDDDVEDLEMEVLEEIEGTDSPDSDDDVDDGALSAKEAAKMLGTDARSLRKFLRSKNGKVGQGNRWRISVDNIAELKKEFGAWGKKAKVAKPKAEGTKRKTVTAKLKDEAVELPDADDDDEAFAELDDLEEPSTGELEEMVEDDDVDEVEDMDFDDE